MTKSYAIPRRPWWRRKTWWKGLSIIFHRPWHVHFVTGWHDRDGPIWELQFGPIVVTHYEVAEWKNIYMSSAILDECLTNHLPIGAHVSLDTIGQGIYIVSVPMWMLEAHKAYGAGFSDMSEVEFLHKVFVDTFNCSDKK